MGRIQTDSTFPGGSHASAIKLDAGDDVTKCDGPDVLSPLLLLFFLREVSMGIRIDRHLSSLSHS